MIGATQIGTTQAPATKPANEAPLDWGPRELVEQFHFWRGVSARRYVHTVYSLLTCPELPQANYILVRREVDGTRRALRIDRTATSAPSLNLAEIRHRGAQLGANEVHVHLLAEDAEAQAIVASDLRVGQFAELSAEPTERGTAH